jgi:hypothetical protein
VNADPAQEQEWLRQNNLIYGGLIGIGVVLVQPFLTAASLEVSATICVVAFSLAIPLLAALVLVNRQEVFRRRVTKAVTVEVAGVVAQLSAATAWSPASGTSAGSPAWPSWSAASWASGSTPAATSAWNSRNPATPSPSPGAPAERSTRVPRGTAPRCRVSQTDQQAARILSAKAE